MNKQEFISGLRARLKGLPEAEVEERLGFYTEMIDDRIEEGLSEEDAINSIGSVDKIAQQILSEIPLAKIVKEKIKPKRSLKGWEIALLAIGSPIWAPLLISALAVVFSLYVSFWSVVICCCYGATVSVGVSALAGIIGGIAFAFMGNVVTGVVVIGAAILCAGLTIPLVYGCKELTKIALRLTKGTVLLIKKCFITKEAE